MTQAIPVPKVMKVYQLIRMTTNLSLTFSNAGQSPVGGNGYIGVGFYLTQSEAEQNRTLEYLKAKNEEQFYVFELEFPNPAYKE
jgi:hypothetical protein